MAKATCTAFTKTNIPMIIIAYTVIRLIIITARNEKALTVRGLRGNFYIGPSKFYQGQARFGPDVAAPLPTYISVIRIRQVVVARGLKCSVVNG